MKETRARSTLEASILYYRAAIEVDAAAVHRALQHATSLGERAVFHYAAYRIAQNNEEEKRLAIDTLAGYQADPDMAKDATLNTILALMYINEKNYRDALRSLHLITTPSQEKSALTVHCYLALDRIDLAEKLVEQMHATDDDDPYTTLASIWVQVAKRKAENSHNLVSELVERFEESPLLLTTLGTIYLSRGQFREAFQHFKRSRELATQNNEIVSPETLINSMVCAYHLGGARSEDVINAIHEEFKRLHPNHPYFTKEKELEAAFDRCAAQYAK